MPCLYICLYTSVSDPEKLQCLSPRIMKWTENIWIFDVSSYASYWEQIALMKRLDFCDLLEMVLEENLNDGGYNACIASSPWKAILMLKTMYQYNRNGCVYYDSFEGKELYQQVSWNVWWKCIEEFVTHLLERNIKKWNLDSWKKACLQLKSGSQKLNFSSPLDMAILNYEGVRRRYGALLADIWEWTCSLSDASSFPWLSWEFREKPSVKRHLDSRVWLWEHVEAWVHEDIDKLSQDTSHKRFYVIEVIWSFVCENQTLAVPIKFRNPHSLFREYGHQRTFLIQAHYSFLKMWKREFSNKSSFEIPEILSWEFSITQYVVLPDIVLDLFGEVGQLNSEEQALFQLENELPVQLYQYRYCSDWVPEYSYLEGQDISSDSKTNPGFRSWLALSALRPLFRFKKPFKLSQEKLGRHPRMLENTMCKWWSGGCCEVTRSYYQVFDDQQNALWASWNGSEWSVWGIFG